MAKVGAWALARQRRQLGVVFGTIVEGTIPLKPSTNDQALSWVIQGGKLAKVPRTIRSCPFKTSRLPKEGWPWDNLGCLNLSPLDQLWELVPKDPRISLGLIQLKAMWTSSRSQALVNSKLD
jgi:hypothetical protein